MGQKNQAGSTIAWMRPDEIAGLTAAARRESTSHFYGKVYARQYTEDMVPVTALPKLEDIEQYRVQMAAISTASFGYWKESDGIQPDYDTVPLRDVARLFAKYDHLYKFREQVRVMVAMLKNREWAEDLAATGDAEELQSVITELVGARLTAPAPDAVDAALTDAIEHGTGEFRVNGDGSTERVDLQAQNRAAAEIVAFSPPARVRDALYQDYAVPKKDGGAS